ncbi:SusD/RagB family nutrient-binding outer membrane lipoprotein [Confluentibacter sediminis]|uniref:SusD/RagB family nutrient-binding outer membrane lipoprotein n=1 Tax=Confluentibacter sediminis TaxID=2219045 RepID=UPI000DACE52C|nr:SusD/RagB family nutrient-binding outer membrane lipoprotein [Confluentibacter sediminis]
MTQNIIKKTILIFVAGILWSSCTKDFEIINTNPKAPVSTAPDLLLPGIISSIVDSWGGFGGEEGLLVTQHAAEIQSTSTDTYSWVSESQPYATGYNTLRNIYNLINASQDSEGLSGYYGIGLILKALTYNFMTDVYGDIPYADAIKGRADANFFPEFTSQKEIYNGMLSDLELANDVLSNDAVTITGDILYAGDVNKWRKLSNSLRLRLLMRISDIDLQTAKAGIQDIVNNPDKYPVFGSNEDMAALQHNTENPPSRFFSRVGSFDGYRLSETLENRLKAMNDVRLKVFAQPITASEMDIYSDNWDDYEGMLNGLTAEESDLYSPTEDPEKSGSNYISKLGVLYACRECSEKASASAAQTIIMSFSEVAFLLAEATQRNFITKKSAEVYYQDGIKASFDYYKERISVGGWTEIAKALENVDMNAYLSQEKVAFSGNIQEDLNKIYLQKWISQYYVGLEAWSNWRRTSQPKVIPGPGAVNDKKVPVRFLYPIDVKSTNNENYKKAVENMGGDTLNNRLWWDVLDNY